MPYSFATTTKIKSDTDLCQQLYNLFAQLLAVLGHHEVLAYPLDPLRQVLELPLAPLPLLTPYPTLIDLLHLRQLVLRM
jgi:hypothetical protein